MEWQRRQILWEALNNASGSDGLLGGFSPVRRLAAAYVTWAIGKMVAAAGLSGEEVIISLCDGNRRLLPG